MSRGASHSQLHDNGKSLPKWERRRRIGNGRKKKGDSVLVMSSANLAGTLSEQ